MRTSKFSKEQMLAIVRQVAAGNDIKDVAREHGISPITVYSWRRKLALSSQSDSDRLRALDRENHRLRQAVIDLTLEKEDLKQLLRGYGWDGTFRPARKRAVKRRETAKAPDEGFLESER